MADNNYTTQPGDRWDTIAYKVYGDAKYADILMKNNPNLIDIFEFSEGVEISAPSTAFVVDEDVPDWRD